METRRQASTTRLTTAARRYVNEPFLTDQQLTVQPDMYNETSNIWVSYDNAQSFGEKGKFVLNNGLGGFTMYEAGGDYDDILVNAIRKGAGMN